MGGTQGWWSCLILRRGLWYFWGSPASLGPTQGFSQWQEQLPGSTNYLSFPRCQLNPLVALQLFWSLVSLCLWAGASRQRCRGSSTPEGCTPHPQMPPFEVSSPDRSKCGWIPHSELPLLSRKRSRVSSSPTGRPARYGRRVL